MKIKTLLPVTRRGALVPALWLTLVAPALAGIGDLDPQFAQGGQVLWPTMGVPMSSRCLTAEYW